MFLSDLVRLKSHRFPVQQGKSFKANLKTTCIHFFFLSFFWVKLRDISDEGGELYTEAEGEVEGENGLFF